MNNFQENPFSKFDWILFLVLAIICFGSFEHSDIIHTATGALGYLNGHIWDFYEYGDSFIQGMNYLPSTFLLFAIWDIPLFLLNIITEPTMGVSVFAIMWFKLLPVSVYLVSGFILYKIGREIGLKNSTAKAMMYIFYTAPIGFFSQFIFGQYDIFTIFFMLLGFLYFLKEDRMKFILFFAIAITFKYFALLIFLPLLLLQEKNIKKIIIQFILVLIPIMAQVLLYFHSMVFRSDVLGFTATESVLQSNIVITQGLGLSIVILGWVFLCGWAYFIQTKTKTDNAQWSIYFCNLVTCVVFGFSLWHPQWLLIAVPFWTMGTIINKKRTAFFWLDIILFIVFLMLVVTIHETNVDQTLFMGGIFRQFYYSSAITMARLFIFNNANVLFSLFTGILMVYTIFKHPKYCEDDFSAIDILPDRNLLRGRFVFCVLLFVIPATFCLYMGLKTDVMTYQAPEQSVKAMDTILDDNTVIGEVFLPQNQYITGVEFIADTFTKENTFDFTVSLQDWNTKKILAATKINSAILMDNRENYFTFPETKLEKGKTYCLLFSAKNTNENNTIALCRGWRNNDKHGYAVIDNKKQDYDLALKIYGK
ncbi:MAG: hypothetical protein RR385_06210 [Clostridiales bacterium]